MGNGLAARDFADFQRAFDPLLTPGARNYWKSHNFKEIAEGLIDILVEFCLRLPHKESEIFIAQMGDATNRVSADATAYPHRDINIIMNVHTPWREEHDDKACSSWARDFYQAAQPYATGGVYVNFVSEGDDNLVIAYAKNAERLARMKSQYDPEKFLEVEPQHFPAMRIPRLFSSEPALSHKTAPGA